jgi:rhodanese-related sulfurtransferase
MSGRPRQVMNGEPKMVTLGGGTPRRVHSRPKAAIAFVEKLGQLDKAQPVLVYCAGGFRSRKAVEMMKPLGFSNIQHLHREYQSWRMGGGQTS